MSEQNIRTRIAPSPTGNFHIGTARSALYNWLFAKKNNGSFILRIEDTDKERSKPEFERGIIESLKMLGLNWDEFYRQSDRTEIYKKYLEKLLESGKAFWCDHDHDYLENEQKGQSLRKEAPRHVCKQHSDHGVIRLAVSDSNEKIIFDDIVRGRVEFDAKLQGDFVIAKNLENPIFHFVVVVDDFEMNISHVIRGEEHISNTPKHIIIQQSLGFTSPIYAHLPLITAADHSKLSKRHGATSFNEFIDQGYIAQALLNYLFVLGYSAPEDKEILSLDEMVSIFDLNKVHKSGAIFDVKKLDWFNGEYMKKIDLEKFIEFLQPYINIYFGEIENEFINKVAPLMRERMTKFSDVAEFDYFFKELEYDTDLLIWKKTTKDQVADSLSSTLNIIEKGYNDENDLRSKLDEQGARLNDRGLVYWPFRVALSGKKFSPDPVNIAIVLGPKKVSERIKKAIDILK